MPQKSTTEESVKKLSNDLPKKVLEERMRGNYQVENELLHKSSVITLPAVNKSLFKKRGKTHYYESFDELTSGFRHVKLPEMKVQTSTLGCKMNDFEIRDELGGNDKLCFKSKVEALRALDSAMVNTNQDGKVTTVYFLNEQRKLCYANCFWTCLGNWWYFDAGRARDESSDVGDRVLYPAV